MLEATEISIDLEKTKLTLQRFLRAMNYSPEFPSQKLPWINKNLIVVGDLHADCYMLEAVIKEFFLEKESENILVFLGDYVDRAPEDCPFGSMETFIRLAKLKIEYPRNIFMLRGNHELYRLLHFHPHELPTEILKRFGEENHDAIYDLFWNCFQKLPLFIISDNGLFLSHGGIYKDATNRGELELINYDRIEAIKQLTWGDPKIAKTYRGEVSNYTRYTQEDFERFMTNLRLNVMIRGHDYNTLGYTLFNKRHLTVFTSRRYKSRGGKGILVAKTPLNKEIITTDDLEVLNFVDGIWQKYETREFSPE